MSNKAAKLAKQQRLEKMARKTKIRNLPLAVLLGLATLLGGVAAVVTFLPRVTVTASDPVNPDDPFSSSITITNTGYIPLNAVVPSLALGTISGFQNTESAPFIRHWYDHVAHITSDTWGIHDMALDDKFTFAINDLVGFGSPFKLQSAEIAIVVDYKIPILSIKRSKAFPLVAKKQTNGQFYWYAEPTD